MNTTLNWEPSCGLHALTGRAKMNATIRRFFEEREVLEVETPILAQGSVTDPALTPFLTDFRLPGSSHSLPLYLQTSPEFAMKRLLAAGTGSIFQIAKAFRNEEKGRHHNPEFTLLEWYRVGFSLFDLLSEVEALIELLASRFDIDLCEPERYSYTDRFEALLGCHPLDADLVTFREIARDRGLTEAPDLCGEDRSQWLDLLFSYYIQPELGQSCLTSIYDYPAILPSLAKVNSLDPRFVERAEVFWNGIELGNGFHELLSQDEQRSRFEADLDRRRALKLPTPSLDERFLASLAAGLPACSGIALGMDRILLILLGAESIDQVLSFDLERA